MIYTDITNKKRIEALKGIIPADVFCFLTHSDLKNYPDGRVDLASGVFVQIQSYYSVKEDEMPFESHKKYIDIQFMIDGVEYCDVSVDTTLSVKKEYDETTDAAFYDSPKLYSRLLLENGDFAVLFPEDIHRPRISVDKKTKIKKAVIKVPVSSL